MTMDEALDILAPFVVDNQDEVRQALNDRLTLFIPMIREAHNNKRMAAAVIQMFQVIDSGAACKIDTGQGACNCSPQVRREDAIFNVVLFGLQMGLLMNEQQMPTTALDEDGKVRGL